MSRSKTLVDIHESSLAAKIHFDAWWALAGEAKGARKVTMHKHQDYFGAAWNAQYMSFFVCFAHLFDRRPDSSSLPTYLAKLKAEEGEAVAAPLFAEYESLASRAKPLIVARHKAVAHVDAELTEKDVFLELNVSWKEIRDVLTETINFVVKILGAKSPDELGFPRDGRLRDATFRVLDALSED